MREKIEKDPTVADLNIQGVYQLQGGIDKYFKEYPDGGNWVGKNYTFDKRFSHVPEGITKSESEVEVLSKCEACEKPWDRFRGKRRCPTCGVPSIICSDCFDANEKSSARRKASRTRTRSSRRKSVSLRSTRKSRRSWQSVTTAIAITIAITMAKKTRILAPMTERLCEKFNRPRTLTKSHEFGSAT